MNIVFDIFPAATPLGTRLVRLTTAQLGVGSAFRVELAGNGSGLIVINRNQPECTAANFAADNYVKVFDLDISTTIPLGGFFLNDAQVQVLSADEEGGELVSFGGPGSMAYLDRAIWWNINYVSFGDDAHYGPRSDGNWWWDNDQYGDILKRAIDEAQDSDRPQHPLAALTYDFTSSLDSAGAAWHSFTGAYSLPIGTNYLDMVQKFRDLGLTIRMSGNLKLQAYQNVFGTNRAAGSFAAGKVRFVNVDGAAGTNIVGELSRHLAPALQLSRVLVKGDYPLPADMRTRVAGSFGVVREGFRRVSQQPRRHHPQRGRRPGAPDPRRQCRPASAQAPVRPRRGERPLLARAAGDRSRQHLLGR